MRKVKTHINFHVINSIKGGAGKSTFALMLANHLIQEGKTTFIIDLDLQGSSWEENYDKFFVNVDSNKKYINDLMYDYSDECITKVIRNIRVTTTSDGSIPSPEDVQANYNIPVYIANPSIDRIDDVQADLFQNAVYEIIKVIRNSNVSNGNNPNFDTNNKVNESNDTDLEVVTDADRDNNTGLKTDTDVDKEINVILDMPPSKDRYAEKVLTHLLLDLNSPLYKEISFDFSYSVVLYMMTNVTKSHRDKNVTYLKDLVRNRSFSETLVDFIRKNRFRLHFVFNDLSKTVKNEKNQELGFTNNMLSKINDELKQVPFSTQNNIENYVKVVFLKHIDFIHKNQVFDMISEQKKYDEVYNLLMDSTACREFRELMNKLKDLRV